MTDPTPFIVQPTALFNLEQLAHTQEAMLRILESIGIAVLDDETLAQLQFRGFDANDGRILLNRGQVLTFLTRERKRNGETFSVQPESIEPSSPGIQVSVSPYPQSVHDLVTDTIEPFTTDRLVEATKLLDVLSLAGVPGCPVDVPPALQPVMQYWVAANYNRRGRWPVDPKSAETVPHIMAMADALGQRIGSMPVYIFSPLTLGSESLRCVLRFRDRLDSVGVSNMPSLGCTASVHVGDAYALSAAEVIGGAMLLEALIDLPVRWRMGMFPIDLRTLAMVFGSPENFLLQLATSEVNGYFHGTPWQPWATDIHSNAKLPGAQACAEKSSLMTTGALLGARRFGSVGTLSLDEAFSAEQLIYDLEIRDHIQRLVSGLDGSCQPERCLRDVAEAVEQKGFVGLDSTVSAHRDVYWYPSLFERDSLPIWQGGNRATNRERAHAKVRELLTQHEFEPEPKLKAELNRVLEKAKRALGR